MENRLIYLLACILYKLNKRWYHKYTTRLDIEAGDPDTLHDILNL